MKLWSGFEGRLPPFPPLVLRCSSGLGLSLLMFVGPYPRTEEDLEALADQPAQASRGRDEQRTIPAGNVLAAETGVT